MQARRDRLVTGVDFKRTPRWDQRVAAARQVVVGSVDPKYTNRKALD